MTDSERDIAKRKIAKLLNMTSENGASEQEAMSALSMAQKLMAEHDIKETEISIKNSKSVKGSCSYRAYGTTRIGQGIATITGKLCDCICWRDVNEGKLMYFGLPHDVEIAAYLFDMLSNTIVVEIDKYKRSHEFTDAKRGGVNAKTLVTSFIGGIERRIFERIKEMVDAKRQDVQAATGTALVVLKDQVVKADFAELGMKLRNRTTTRTMRSENAYNAGQAAGNNVELNKGVNGKSQGVLS